MTPRNTTQIEPINLPFIPPLVFNQQIEKQEQKVETISSIEKAQNSPSSSYVPSKPTLDKPKEKNPDLQNYSSTMDFLEKIIALEKKYKRIESWKCDHIEHEYNEAKKLSQEEFRVMKEALQHENNVTFWSLLQDIGNIFVSTVSTVLGFSVLSSGSTILGATLISSGVLAITNTVFKQTGTWDWIARQLCPEDENLRNQIAFALPTVVTIITTILGISGTIGAYYYKELKDFERVMVFLQTASSLVTGTTAIGNGVASSRALSSGAKLSFLHSMGSFSNMDLRNTLQHLTIFFDNQVQFKEIAGEIIKAVETQNQIVMTQQAV